MQGFAIVSLLIAICAVVFALQNQEIVSIKFLAWRFDGSLALILLLTFAGGFVASALMSLAAQFRRRLRDRGPAPGDEPASRHPTEL